MSNAATTVKTTDILSQIAARDAAPVKKTSTRQVKRYYVCVGTCLHMRSRRFYTFAAARTLASRAKRMGLDAYVSCPMSATIDTSR